MTLRYKNCEVHYTDSGTGNPIVFLHGFLENSTMWKTLIHQLPETYRCICIDLFGHGKTENLGYIHTMEDMAELVYHVLDALKINSSYVIGHSMGGYVALALAESHPEVFKGLCLMNSTFEADDDELKTRRTRANIMATIHYDNLVRQSFSNLFAPESKITYKHNYIEALDEALKTTVRGYIAAQEGMKQRPNRFSVLKSLDAKKLIIVGLKDPVVNRFSIKKNVVDTNIEYVEISGGHMSHIENISDLSYIIKRFIE